MLWAGLWWFALILPDLAGWLSIRYQIMTIGALASDDVLGPSIYGMLIAAGTVAISMLARRLQWRSLRALTAPAWVALAVASALMLGGLYFDNRLPVASTWLAC